MFGWLLIYYAKTPFYLILSRVVSGLAGGGLYAIIPGYISEIADDKIRGTLGSTLVFACNLGLFVAYVFGEYVEYLTIPWLMVPATLAFLLLFARVPDSPTFLAKRKLFGVRKVVDEKASFIHFKFHRKLRSPCYISRTSRVIQNIQSIKSKKNFKGFTSIQAKMTTA